MTVIITINKDVSLIVDFNKQQILSIIDSDYRLITHLTQIFYLYECNRINEKSNTRNCYIQVPNCDLIQESYLHRIILRYYSQYDKKLDDTLNNKDYEVNHKNKLRFDNRISNLEIVTKQGNIQHEFYKPYSNSVIIKSEYIKQIQDNLKNEQQYTSKRKYLEKKNKYNWNYLSNYEWEKQDEKFFKCKYIRLNNYEMISNTNLSNYIYINILIKLEENIFTYIKSTNSKLLSYSNYSIIRDYTRYRYKIITNEYFKILGENINKKKYRYLKEVLEKFKLLNLNNKPLCYDDLDKNRLIKLIHHRFIKGIVNDYPYFIYLNNVLCTNSINDVLPTSKFYLSDKPSNYTGKYNSIRVAYFLGLLTRLEESKLSTQYYNNLPNNKKKKHKRIPNFYTIPKLTTSLLDKANDRAKKLLDLKLNKITYFILAENFDTSIADEVYRSIKLKKYYENNCKKALNIINNTIKSLSKTKIKNRGYIKVEDIFESVSNMSHYRQMLKLNEDDISKGFINFISTCINYIPSTKGVLKELDLEVVCLSKGLIDKIDKYQKDNTSFKIYNNLKSKEKVIVLNEILK